MAWVFANWWQVLIVVWFGGFLSELFNLVLRTTVRVDLKLSNPAMQMGAKVGYWIGPFIWPLTLLLNGFVKRKGVGGLLTLGGGLGVGPAKLQFGVNAQRLLEDLTKEFPVDPPRHHALMLVDGGNKGDLGIVLQRPDERWDQLVLTTEDQTMPHEKLVDGICDFVDALDVRRGEAKTCRFEVRSTDGDLLTLCKEALGSDATETQVNDLLVQISQLNEGDEFLSPQLWKPGRTVVLPRVVCLALQARAK